MSTLQIPATVREAIRKSLRNRKSGEVVAISEVTAAVRKAFASAELDPEQLEDAIAQEAVLAKLAIEFDQNAHRH